MKHLLIASQSRSHVSRVESLLPCEVTADGYSIEGKVFEIYGADVCILLPTPLFARLRSMPVVLTIRDGSWGVMMGYVKCQQQIGIGEVLILIQIAQPLAIPRMTLECRDPSNYVLDAYPAKKGWLKWVRRRTGSSPVSFQEQRLIPRLPIHTTCSVVTKNMSTNGITRDLSFTGFSVLFSDFAPECLWNALLHIKFVRLYARPIGVAHHNRGTVVRFRVESIQEGENRWRDLHYSFWQHLS